MEEVSQQLKDTVMICETLLQRGAILKERDEKFYDKSDSCFRVAYGMAKRLPRNNRLLQRCISSLTELAIGQRDGKKSLLYARQYLALLPDSVFLENAYYYIGKSYYLTHQFDSAKAYIQKALTLSSAVYAIKINAFNTLRDIAEMQKDWETALRMEQLRAHYNDSLQAERQPKALNEAVENAWRKQLSDEQMVDNRRNIVIFVLIVIILAIVSILKRYGFLKKRNTVRKRKVDAIYKKRIILCEDTIESSAIYIRMKNVIQSYSDRSSEWLHANEWRAFLDIVEKCFPKMIDRLKMCQLTEDEIYLFCLHFTRFKVSEYGYLINCTRDGIYKKRKRIQEKIKFRQEGIDFREMLKEWVKEEIKGGRISLNME